MITVCNVLRPKFYVRMQVYVQKNENGVRWSSSLCNGGQKFVSRFLLYSHHRTLSLESWDGKGEDWLPTLICQG